jgi:hypothetical protein
MQNKVLGTNSKQHLTLFTVCVASRVGATSVIYTNGTVKMDWKKSCMKFLEGMLVQDLRLPQANSETLLRPQSGTPRTSNLG